MKAKYGSSIADENLAHELRYMKDTLDFDNLVQKIQNTLLVIFLLIISWIDNLWINESNKIFNLYSSTHSTNV